MFCFYFLTEMLRFPSTSKHQESKKHLAGLGSLGLSSLITEITANEDEDKEENRDSGSMDAEGEGKHMTKLSMNIARNRME